jgi:hypothetical protein
MAVAPLSESAGALPAGVIQSFETTCMQICNPLQNNAREDAA